MFCPAEDQHLAEFRLYEKFVQYIYLRFSSSYTNDVLVHAGCGIAGLDRDVHRVDKKIRDEPLDGARKRRREKERVPLFRHVRENMLHVIDESHVEHPVGLVENNSAEFRKVENAAFEEVLQAPRRTNDHVRIAPKRRYLTVYVRAANAGNRADTE